MLPILFGGSPRLKIDANTHIIVDGNSIYTGVGGDPMDQVLATIPPFLGSGCTFSNLAAGGQTWTGMRASPEDVDGAYVEGKVNILIAGETTNEAYWGSNTGPEIWAIAKGYFEDRKTAHPDLKTIVCGSIPFWGAPNNNIGRNQRQIDFDTAMQAEWRGVTDAFVSYRSFDMPWFNHDGSLVTYFSDHPTIWTDAYLHPTDLGKQSMAGAIAKTVKRMAR